MSLIPLPVGVKFFPGPAALLDARADNRPGVSYGRGAGAWFLRVVNGYGSVLKSLSRFPVAFSWIRPGPLAITLLVEAVVWFCTSLCRTCIALDLPVCAPGCWLCPAVCADMGSCPPFMS